MTGVEPQVELRSRAQCAYPLTYGWHPPRPPCPMTFLNCLDTPFSVMGKVLEHGHGQQAKAVCLCAHLSTPLYCLWSTLVLMLLTSWPQSAGSPACSAPVHIRPAPRVALGSLGVRAFMADRSACRAAMRNPAPVTTGLPESEITEEFEGCYRETKVPAPLTLPCPSSMTAPGRSAITCLGNRTKHPFLWRK